MILPDMSERELGTAPNSDEWRYLEDLYKGQPEETMPRRSLSESPRLLAVRRCMLICLTNGWAPPAEAVWRLVELREALLEGKISEPIIPDNEWNRLRFAKHLYETGRLQS